MAYIGRSGWNNLELSGAIRDDEHLRAVDDSYLMVTGKLPARLRPAGWDALAGRSGTISDAQTG